MSSGHDHGSGGLRAGARHQRRLFIAFGLIASFFLVEAVAGVLTNSLALLSDAGHTFTDVLGLGMALAAIQLANRAAGKVDASRTFGLYRLEILAAFVNALLLFGVAVYVLVEALRRLTATPEVLGAPMLVVATLGLVVNLVAFTLLRSGSKDSVNIEGAYLEVLADTLGSVGVIIAAVVLQVTGWTWVDPAMAVAVGLFILPRTWRLGGQAVRVLIQAAPPMSTWLGSAPTLPRSSGWSTCTTCTCGRLPPRWRRPRPTSRSPSAPTATGCSTRPASSSRSATRSTTPPSRLSLPTTLAVTR